MDGECGESGDPWRKNKSVTMISYADMTFAGLSMAFSIHIFVNSLPYSKEDSKIYCGAFRQIGSNVTLAKMHDGMVIVFMALVLVHFMQLFEAVMLLSASEITDDPQGAMKLATSWSHWSIFFIVLLIGKLASVVFALKVNFWYGIYIIFILAEIVIRPIWRRQVKEFVKNLGEVYLEENMNSTLPRRNLINQRICTTCN